MSEINRTAAEFTQNGRKRKSMFGRQLCECHRVLCVACMLIKKYYSEVLLYLSDLTYFQYKK